MVGETHVVSVDYVHALDEAKVSLISRVAVAHRYRHLLLLVLASLQRSHDHGLVFLENS